MSKKYSCFFRINFILLLIAWFSPVYSDNFNTNTYNNHGVIGLINTPTARFYEEGAHGVTLYDGTPDQKITFTSSPYDWMEASFQYNSVQNKRYCDLLLNTALVIINPESAAISEIRLCICLLTDPNSTSPILAVPATVRIPSGDKNNKSPPIS